MLIETKNYFSRFSDDSRVWVFMGEYSFSEKESEFIIKALNNFIPEWNAHGSGLKADFKIIINRFIVIVVDEILVAASGCSIDSLLRYIKNIEKGLGYSLTNRMLIGYEDSGEISTTSFLNFKSKIKNKEIDENTLVFDNSVALLSDFKEKWILPLKESWTKRFLQ